VACWKKVNIWDKLERPMQQAESFSQFFTNIRRLDQSQLVTFAMIAWSIWRKRNTKLWDDKNEIVESHAQSVLCMAASTSSQVQPWEHDTTLCRALNPLETTTNRLLEV
jgi:hypothetical protein